MTAPAEACGRRIVRACALALAGLGAAPAGATQPSPEQLAALPVAFERNVGQADPAIDFIARGPGHQAYLDARSAVFQLDEGTITMRFEGARDVQAVAQQPLDFRTNHFHGAEPTEQFTNVPNFSGVRYPAVYPGIDLVYYGRNGQLEYDLVVAPRASADAAQLAFPDSTTVTITPRGELRLVAPGGAVVFHKPIAYQHIGGARREVQAGYRLIGKRQVAFALGAYDRDAELVIDPLLAYSTLIWGGVDMALDALGNIYLVGTRSAGGISPPPTTGGYQTSVKGNRDALVMKLNPAGTQVLYATYIGARRADTYGESIAVDASGNAYITGTTTGSAFPTTTGAYQRTYATGASYVTKFNATGSALVYSTFVNGVELEAIAVDGTGSAHVTGVSRTGTFTTTPGALQTTRPSSSCAAVLRLNPAGSAAVYATFLGGSIFDDVEEIALGPDGNAYVVGRTGSYDFPVVNAYQPNQGGGEDVFVSKLNASGSALLYSTFLGGSQNDRGTAIAIDAAGNMYVVGRSHSTNFPTTLGTFQPTKAHSDPIVSNAFITKIAATGNSLAYSSYLGGRWCLSATVFQCFTFGEDFDGIDGATTIVVDEAGAAYFGGYANSAEFPLVDSLHGQLGTPGENTRMPFVAKVSPAGDRLIYSTVFGTRDTFVRTMALALNPAGSLYASIFGCCWDYEPFPLTGGPSLATGTTGALARITPGRYPTTVASLNPRVAGGQSFTLRAEVRSPKAPGTVTFATESGTLGTAPVLNGRASLTLSLPPGVYHITAVHDADGVVSPPTNQLVTTP